MCRRLFCLITGIRHLEDVSNVRKMHFCVTLQCYNSFVRGMFNISALLHVYCISIAVRWNNDWDRCNLQQQQLWDVSSNWWIDVTTASESRTGDARILWRHFRLVQRGMAVSRIARSKQTAVHPDAMRCGFKWRMKRAVIHVTVSQCAKNPQACVI